MEALKQWESAQGELAEGIIPLYQKLIANNNRIGRIYGYDNYYTYGYDVVYGSWRALAAPKGTPAEVVDKREEIFYEATQTQEFIDFCASNNNEIDLLNKEEFAQRFVDQEALIKDVCAIYAQLQNS